MALETANNIFELDKTWPLGGDPLSRGAAHIRTIKDALKKQFPGENGAGFEVVISATEDELDTLIGVTSPVQEQLDNIRTLGAVPLSGILMYTGTTANIPANYQFCDGTNGTPDMRGSFVTGTVSEVSSGEVGGVADAIIPAHTHTFNHSHTASITDGGSHTHAQGGGTFDSNASSTSIPDIYAAAPYITVSTDSAGSHNHTITAAWSSASTSTIGESATDRNLPNYYKLAFIMRVS